MALRGRDRGGCVTATGLVLFMHEVTNWVLPIGILLLLFTFFVWWRDVIKEAHSGFHTKVGPARPAVYGMALFIASEVMFLLGIFLGPTSMRASTSTRQSSSYRMAYTGGMWPPEGLEVIPAFDLPLLKHHDPAALGLHDHLGRTTDY